MPTTRALSALLNHLLGQAAWARDTLAPHAGRSVRFAVAPLAATLTVGSDGLLRAAETGGEPDVTITLPGDAPLRALQGGEALMAAAHVSGAAEFANDLGVVLRHLRWDAEEDLSRLVGDIAAHRLAGAFRAFAAWQMQAAGRLADNIGEYLVEERQLFVRPSELAQFAAELKNLELAADGLERRLQHLTGAR